MRIILLALVFVGSTTTWAADSEGDGSFNPGEMINHHIKDSHVWEIAHGVEVHLPVILYTDDGLKFFSSADFYDEHHNPVSHEGFVMDHDHITATDGSLVIDFSITKNVLFLFLNSGLMLLIFFSVAWGYKKNAGKAPKGIQSFFEPIIIFVRDEIVKPNIGEKKYERYLPYLLTLFFFIWFGNLLGLLPGAANLTGNIAVTMVLAVGTFLLTNLSGNKHYWGHILNTPGVPFALKPIIVPVEIIGMFTKPISLMVRLFVAITAGHIVLLSLMSLTFIFHSYLVGIGTTIVVVVITFIEILVATIQAYV
ncbi:MAG: F0F1 ATP synthase subunit A, partial [Bacteroidota bacterium]